MSLYVFRRYRSEVLTAVDIFLWISWWIFFWDPRLQCSGTFGRIKSRYWLMFASLLLSCTHAIEALFFPYLESGVRPFEVWLCAGPWELLERSALDLPAATGSRHLPPAYNLNRLVMGGGTPPTSLTDSILSTISVSLILLLSGRQSPPPDATLTNAPHPPLRPKIW